MAVPSITSVDPALGPTTGQTLVTIVGQGFRLPPPPPSSGLTYEILPQTVEVLFGSTRATGVAVREDPTNLPNGTILTCLSPAHTPGAIDVVLRNLDDSGAPIPGEEATAAGAFAFQRADLTTEPDLTRLVRTLLRAIKAQVQENLSLTVHTDFDDTTEDGLQISAVAELPALVLTGPELDENRFYSLNAQPEDGGGDAAGLPFKVRAVPYTVDLVFELVGISSYTVELLSLINQCVLFFHKNKTIEMARDAADPAKGRVAYEMDFAPRGQPKVQSRANDSNVRHFVASFVIRGFDIDEPAGVAVGEGRTNQPVTVATEQTGLL